MAGCILGRHYNVPKRAQDKWPKSARSPRSNQCVQLEAKRAAAERKSLDQDGVWLRNLEGGQQRGSTCVAQRLTDRLALAIDELFEPRVAGSDRRELYETCDRWASQPR
jgi:hypothetical protein